ncbi:glycosyltransferase family 4 protein [Rhodohalobacter mucosus]|nr:glycosyltransferase family 4 protein [Rhodohalobacter mucosus]
MNEFADNGHQVTVLASRPRRVKKPTTFTTENNLKICRVKTGNISKSNPLEKMLSLFFLNRQFEKALNKYLANENYDLIIFNTPPITLSPFIEKLKDKYGCKFYLLLKDIWPYGFVDFDLIRKNGLIYNYFRKHEKRLYRVADRIGCMSPLGIDFVLSKNPELDPEKLEVCPNAIRVKDVNSTKELDIRKKYKIPEDATIYIYSGNISLGHGIEFLGETITDLKGYKKAFFLIGGSGLYFEKIRSQLKKSSVSNALVYDYLPKEDFENLLSICDVGLILLSSKYNYPQFPSRLLSYLHNRMAVLCAVNTSTDIGQIVEENQAGLSVTHGDRKRFIEAIKSMSENTQMLKEMKDNSFHLLNEKYTTDIAYRTILNSIK